MSGDSLKRLSVQLTANSSFAVKRRLSGCQSGHSGVGVDKPTIASQLRSARLRDPQFALFAGLRRASRHAHALPFRWKEKEQINQQPKQFQSRSGSVSSAQSSRNSSPKETRRISRRRSYSSSRSASPVTKNGLPTVLIDVQIRLPESQDWPEWKRERVASGLLKGGSEWMTLQQLDERMRDLLLIRPVAAKIIARSEENASTRAKTSTDKLEIDSGSVQRTQKDSTRHDQTLSNNPSKPDSTKALESSQQTMLKSFISKSASLKSSMCKTTNHKQHMPLKPKSKDEVLSASNKTDESRRSSISRISVKEDYPKEESCSQQDIRSNAPEKKRKRSEELHWGAALPQELNHRSSQQKNNLAHKGEPKKSTNDCAEKPNSTNTDAVNSSGQRFHKVTFGRERRLKKTASDQNICSNRAGKKGFTSVTESIQGFSPHSAVKSQSSERKSERATTKSAVRLCGDDPYTSKLRNQVEKLYYSSESSPYGNSTSSSSIMPQAPSGAPSIVIEQPEDKNVGLNQDLISDSGPVENLLQVPGYF